jgi:hypothetical protein
VSSLVIGSDSFLTVLMMRGLWECGHRACGARCPRPLWKPFWGVHRGAISRARGRSLTRHLRGAGPVSADCGKTRPRSAGRRHCKSANGELRVQEFRCPLIRTPKCRLAWTVHVPRARFLGRLRVAGVLHRHCSDIQSGLRACQPATDSARWNPRKGRCGSEFGTSQLSEVAVPPLWVSSVSGGHHASHNRYARARPLTCRTRSGNTRAG